MYVYTNSIYNPLALNRLIKKVVKTALLNGRVDLSKQQAFCSQPKAFVHINFIYADLDRFIEPKTCVGITAEDSIIRFVRSQQGISVCFSNPVPL